MRRALLTLALLVGLAAPALATAKPSAQRLRLIRVEHIVYRAHDGALRPALLLLPASYHGQRIPLVISPHGRNTLARADAARWGGLPGEGGFAVICPGGEGRRLPLFSWGAPGQITDLARMPAIAAAHGVDVDPRLVYAIGESMGGQETLLLLARYPRLLAAAVAFDPVIDMARRYRQFAHEPRGAQLQRLARLEIGGTPSSDPAAYAIRSPDRYEQAIAAARVPLQIYWSIRDGVLPGERAAVDAFAAAIDRHHQLPVHLYRGDWHHGEEMGPHGQLAHALARLGLLPWNLAYSPRALVRAAARHMRQLGLRTPH
jgi:dienelactone hydrolase